MICKASKECSQSHWYNNDKWILGMHLPTNDVNQSISLGTIWRTLRKTSVTQLLTHWSHCMLVLSHRYYILSLPVNVANHGYSPHRLPSSLLFIANRNNVRITLLDSRDRDATNLYEPKVESYGPGRLFCVSKITLWHGNHKYLRYEWGLLRIASFIRLCYGWIIYTQFSVGNNDVSVLQLQCDS